MDTKNKNTTITHNKNQKGTQHTHVKTPKSPLK